jgi:UDP-2,3-diacylglucosamine pyrophosphatase LpxH
MICGHIHRAEIRDIDGVTYCNDGDWVESCSALLEDFDGRLSLVHWMQSGEAADPASTPAMAPVLDAAA